MATILRVVRLKPVSSAYFAQSPPASATWQSTQFIPVAAANMPIVSMNSSTGMPAQRLNVLEVLLRQHDSVGGRRRGFEFRLAARPAPSPLRGPQRSTPAPHTHSSRRPLISVSRSFLHPLTGARLSTNPLISNGGDGQHK